MTKNLFTASKLLLATLLVGTLFIALRPNHASALSGSDFKAGRIIDDGIFFNPNSLATGDIQNFLNSKVPVCDTNGQQTIYDSVYGDTVTRAVYSQRRGVSTPFTCLKDYRQDTVAKAAETGLCKGYPQVNQSAAEIIYGVAQSCGINPEVLIVLLQKEQALVTDDWPWSTQYRSATGYGCPDTAPCDSQYYGFFNQVYSAARQYRNYAVNAGSFYYFANRNNYVQYNPDSNCGGSTILIENQATAGLYNYTPYQPNQAALNNLYGTGDGCSAYGNRNFWRLFNDWFGGTLTSNYAAQPVWQSVFTDSTKSTSLGWNATLLPGQTAYVVIVMRNTGNITWTRSGSPNDTRLATYDPWGRQSGFCTGAWIPTSPSCTRPAMLSEASVAPGATGTFEFPISAPGAVGSYKEAFSPVVDGKTVFSSGVAVVQFNVVPPSYSAQAVWQTVYTDASKSKSLGWNATLVPGQKAYALIAFKNTSNFTWTRSGGIFDTRLVTYNSWGRQSGFCTGDWIPTSPVCTRPAMLNEASVAPGAMGTFEFPISAPGATGIFNESFGLVVDGKSTFNSGYMTFQFNVQAPKYDAQAVWQSVFTDNTKSTSLGWNATLTPSQPAYAVVAMKNTGNIIWTKPGGQNEVRLVTYNPWGRQSLFCTNNWIPTIPSCTRPSGLKESSVLPGEVGTFEFPVIAPNQPGIFNESFGLVIDGKSVFSNGFMNFQFTIQ